jgi:hypothetical protein
MLNHRLLVLAFAVAGFAAPPPTQKQTAAAHARTGGPAPKTPDAEMEKAIRTRFAKSKIAVNQFQVRVQGGTATIEGRTDVVQHKGTATRLARSAGAVNVVNKVQVSEAARQKAAGQLTTGRRRAQVKRSEVERR